MKISLPKTAITLLTTGLLFSSLALAQSEQVGSAASNLLRRYQGLLQVPDNDPTSGGDLQIICMNLVFHDWTKNYLGILEHTDVNSTEVGAPLTELARNWFISEDAIRVAEYYRPGVSDAVEAALEDLRTQHAQPATIDLSKMTLADIEDATYFANLNYCLEDDLVTAVQPKVRPVDPTAQLPAGLIRNSRGKVAWVKSNDGGIQPIWKEPSSGVSAQQISYVESFETYQSFFDRLQHR